MGIILRIMIMVVTSVILFILGIIKGVKLLKYLGIVLFVISLVGLFIIWMALGSM